MRACVSCGHTDRPESPTLPKMCSRCWWSLPAATRAAYQHGSIGIKQITRASRDSQQSVRKFGGGSKRRSTGVLLVGLLAIYTAGGCRDHEQPATTTTAAAVAATAAPAGVLPARDEEFERRLAETFERASRPATAWKTAAETWQQSSEKWQAVAEKWQRIAEKNERTAVSAIASAKKCMEICGQASDTTQPLRQVPVHTVRFDTPALPTPILDQRKRECIAYPLTAGFSRVRYNLLLQPNMYVVARKLWSDPKWLATFRVDGGTFPVNLWRVRGGVATFWKQVRVQAGPGLPTGNPQEGLSAEFFRGGDVLCVEATRNSGPLFVAYDQQTGLVVQPQLSVVQNTSNDSTPMPGAWMVIGGEVE